VTTIGHNTKCISILGNLFLELEFYIHKNFTEFNYMYLYFKTTNESAGSSR
jgi:hypothetical protein